MFTMTKSRCLLAVLVCFVQLSASMLAYSAEAPDGGYQPRPAPEPVEAKALTTTATARALEPPMSQGEVASREQALRDHHLPIPIGDTPPELLARALPPPPAQTNPAPDTGPMAVTTPLAMNRGLTDAETANATSTVNEPSVATRGAEVLVTGNWFAAFSKDGGNTFKYINPDSTFPFAAGGFCCDQVALYEKTRDLMFWFLQYIEDGNGENVIRLAVAHDTDIPDEAWRYYDFSPQLVGNWSGEWFDYPDLATSDQHLFITTNAFNAAGMFTRAVVLRISLDELQNYAPLNYESWDTSQHASLRLTQGAADTMYFGGHDNAAAIRVFAWPEASGSSISFNNVPVTTWNITGSRPGWTARSDYRITAGWFANGEVGFGWTAAASGAIAQTHVRFAVIDVNTWGLVMEPHLWNQNFPFAYPSTAPNGAGRIGLGVHFGVNPNHAVGVLETVAGLPMWQLETTATSTHSPSLNRWGDYAAVRSHPGNPDDWVATGYSLEGGGSQFDVVTRYLQFNEDQQPTVVIRLEDPARELESGDSMWVRATVTVGGSPGVNRTVDFTTSDAASLSVTPASAQTDGNGVAQVTLNSRAAVDGIVNVTAEDSGVTVSAPVTVKVPKSSNLGFLFLLLAAALAGVAARGRARE